LSTEIDTKLSDATAGGAWTSGTPSVATVGSAGLVTGVSAGIGAISYTVTTNGCSTTVTTNVTVNTPHNGLNFDGVDDYVTIPNMVSGTSFTIEYWMKTTQISNTGTNWFNGNGIVDAEVPTVQRDFGTSLLNNKIAFGIGQSDVTIQSSSIVNTGDWTHVAASWNQGTGQMVLYINGAQEATATASTATRTAPANIRFGAMQTLVSYFNGTLDEVRIWNTVRTQSQIQANMNCDIPQQSGLVGYYRLDQGTADGTNTGLTFAYDYSGNARCGTLSNMALTGTTSNYVTGAVGGCNTITETNDAPTISGTGNINVNNIAGLCRATVTYTPVISGALTTTYAFTGATARTGTGTGSGQSFNVGSTSVTISATNLCGTTTATFTVTVTDNQNPTITAPVAITVNADAGACAASGYALGSATTADNCGVASVTNNNAGSYAVGTHTITWTVTDIHGRTATATQGITVVDNQNPTITAPAAITVNADAGSCTATGYTLGFAITADNCGVASVTNNDAGTYAVGTHTITWTVTDIHGRTATAAQSITVVDDQDPTITAPSAITVNADAGSCAATGYALGTATTADNCGVASVTNDDAGTYAVGTHTITWTVTDVHGRTATATQNITVGDDQDPTIMAPAAITVNADAGSCAATGYALGSATTADNCGVASVASDDAGTYAVGMHTITWTVTDAHGRTATATQSITVVDDQDPTITAPATITVNADAGSCAATGYALGTPATADNCDVASVTNDDAGTYTVGTHTITWTVTDVHGHTATATQSITVVDDQDPTITAPAAITVSADAGSCAATGYALGTAATADNCGVASVTNDDAGTYAVGSHTITWSVTDVHGRTATATQSITVVDDQDPTITAPAAITVSADAGSCAATGYALGTAAAADNCGVASVTNDDAGTYAVGSHTITWTVTDVHGRTATATQSITVVDDQDPTITAPAAITVSADAGSCAATGYALGTATTADNCGVANVTNDDAGTYAVGSHTITWTVTDVHGHVATATQGITVVDNENPAITAPANITVNNTAGVCNASVTLGTPTTADNCGVAGVTNNHSSAVYPVGTTTVTWTVTDIHGNSMNAAQTVTVNDNEAPHALCQNYTLNLAGGSGSITAANIDNGSYDNCGIANMSVSPSAFSCSNAGANTVTLTVVDVHGNSSTCTATVTVQYQPACAISVTPSNATYTGGNPNTIYLGYGPQSATFTATASGGAGFTYSWSPSACLSNASVANPVFTPTVAGYYTYTCTVTNSNGCTSTCTVTMCVIDAVDHAHSNKVLICHVPPGNPSGANTLSVSASAVPAHLSGHSGDRLGSCNSVCGASAKFADITHDEADHEHDEADAVKLYPNPTDGSFTVIIPAAQIKAQIVVTDVAGRVLETRLISGNSGAPVNFNIGQVASGMYLVKINAGGYSTIVKLIVR
jgi:hypothetical protein